MCYRASSRVVCLRLCEDVSQHQPKVACQARKIYHQPELPALQQGELELSAGGVASEVVLRRAVKGVIQAADEDIHIRGDSKKDGHDCVVCVDVAIVHHHRDGQQRGDEHVHECVCAKRARVRVRA